MRIFRKEVKTMKDETAVASDEADEDTDEPAAAEADDHEVVDDEEADDEVLDDRGHPQRPNPLREMAHQVR